MGKFVSVRELAGLLPGRGGRSMNPKTVRRFIAEGKIPAVRIGGYWLVAKADVAKLLGHPLEDPGPGPALLADGRPLR